ncbi:MAG TPA: Txe/YoeB family addiction module toxin [Longimicrobium sp.]|jgi:toxin YoeB
MASSRDETPPRETGKTLKLITNTTFIVDLQHWIGTNPRTAIRILRIVLEVARDPRAGIGKPEPLKHFAPGHWSRRVDDAHRLVYRFDHMQVELVSARYHYA